MPDTTVEHLQPGMKLKVRQLVNDCLAEHLPVVIVETLRSFERQTELFRQRPVVTKAKAGFSYHNFGLAVDLVLLVDGKPSWDFDPHGKVWQRVVTLAKGRGLDWGGDWKTFPDIPHFQDRDRPTLAMCRSRWPHGWQPTP